MVYSGVGGKLIHEKNLKSENLVERDNAARFTTSGFFMNQFPPSP
jgi:hypothetical protein